MSPYLTPSSSPSSPTFPPSSFVPIRLSQNPHASSSTSDLSSHSLSPTPTLVAAPFRSSSSSAKPSPSSTPSHSPTSTLFPTSHSPSRTPSTASHASSHRSLDSVWNAFDTTHWEWRQREDACRLAELKGATPYLSFGPSHANQHYLTQRRRGGRRAAGEGEGAAQMGTTPSALGRAEEGGEDEAEYEGGLDGEELGGEEEKPRHWVLRWADQNRRKIRRLMRMKRLHLIIIGLVAFDLVIVIVELIVALLTAGCMSEEIYEHVLRSVEESHGHLTPASFACALAPTHSREVLEEAIFGVNLALLSVFMTEVLAAIWAFGPITYMTSAVTLIDGFVVVTTLCLDVYFHLSSDPAAKSPIAVVILRLWKIFRAIHAIGHALSLHYNEMMESAEEGRKQLETERMVESIRLNYVRKALIRATGHDVDPVLIEDEVQRERAAIEVKRKIEEERVYQELRTGSMFRVRTRHGGISNLPNMSKVQTAQE